MFIDKKWIVVHVSAVAILLATSIMNGLTGLLPLIHAQEEIPREENALVMMAMGTAFTYQGTLNDGGIAANGDYDFQFALFDDPAVGSQVGSSINQTIAVSDGYFSATLDFGSGAFNGEARYLEIAVQLAGGGGFTTLAPRQPLTPAPYALALPGMWTEQNATSPNLIGGSTGNSMADGVVGGVIAGGGESANINRVYDSYGTVSGGRGNVVGIDDGNLIAQDLATVGGGDSNTASGGNATVGGGAYNNASGDNATVGGGAYNNASGDNVTVDGGFSNTASGSNATVGGGAGNTASSSYATVGGGYSNAASDGYTTVGGGVNNDASGGYATVGGGAYNLAAASFATIAGGGLADTNDPASNNRVYDDYGTVGGGGGNVVGADDGNSTNQHFATVGGGESNNASKSWATVGGGVSNSSGYIATVGGGYLNNASGYYATVGGGWANEASGYSATVGGGITNAASGGNATVGGGNINNALANFTTVGGGLGNDASAVYATVPGGLWGDASHYGELAYASGRFAETGDAQSSLYVLRQETSDDLLNELFLDGSSERITLANNRVMTFDILVVGTHIFSGGSSAGYQVTGVIRNINGTTSLVGTPIKTVVAENVAGWDVQVTADDALDALVIKAQGSSGTTIRWVASVRTVEVGRVP